MPDAHRNPPRRGRGNESPIHLNQAQVVRFWTHVRKDGASGCWVWASYRTRSGYGRFSVGDIDLRAHRVSWILVRGQLNPGDTLDHLCRNRACVNPDHLEVVDHRTNIMRGESPTAINARKTHCPLGHEYTPENTSVIRHRGATHRQCRECRRVLRAKMKDVWNARRRRVRV
jgi:hypothetical protein